MAKKVEMFIQQTCPHCIRARKYLDELKSENPEYNSVDIEMIDELADPRRADQYDYWYVPTFYVDGEKLHEGTATKSDVENVLKKALAS